MKCAGQENYGDRDWIRVWQRLVVREEGEGRLLTSTVSLFCDLKISAMRKWRCLYNSAAMLINYVSVHLL